MMPFYRICPICGAHLDPGELCSDCREAEQNHGDKKRDVPQPAKQTERLKYGLPEQLTLRLYRAGSFGSS